MSMRNKQGRKLARRRRSKRGRTVERRTLAALVAMVLGRHGEA